MARQSVTMFDLRGGLNSEASPINMPPNELIDVSNIQINSDGSIEPRKAIDFLDTTHEYLPYSVDFNGLFGKEIAPCVSCLEAKLVDSTGLIIPLVFVQAGLKMYVYDYSDIYSLTAPATPYKELDLDGNVLAWQYKSTLLYDKNRIIVINPYLQECFISLNGDGELVVYDLSIRMRELSNDTTVDSRVNYNGKSFLCIKSHNQSLESNLVSGTNINDYWAINGPAISGDPAWSSVSTDGASSWKPRASYLFNQDAIVENGFYWKIVKVENYVVSKTSQFWKTQPLIAGVDIVYSGNYEPSWPATPAVGNEVIEYTSMYDEYSDGIRTIWQAYASTTDTANTVFSSGVVNVLELYSSDTQYSSPRFFCGDISQGRLWLAGFKKTPSSVYFSQTVDSEWRKYGRMYQFADPNSNNDTEKVDTDGGVLSIGAAEEILALKNFGSGILAFATNGVWYIYGQENFRPTNFSVEKISDAGAVSKEGITVFNNIIAYAAIDGIYIITPGEIEATKLKVQSITKKKINTFYNSIPLIEKKSSKLLVDSSKNELYYFVNFSTKDWSAARNVYNQPTDYRDALVYSFANDSWTKWSLSDSTSASDIAIAEMFFVDGGQISTTNVIDSNGTLVVDEAAVQVVAQDPEYTSNTLVPTFMGFQYDAATPQLKLWFLQLRVDSTLVDFYNGTDAGYDSAYSWYSTFAWNEFGDILHKKGIPYIKTVFERTESGTVVDNVDINAGGCMMRVDWNWSTNSTSPYYGTARQVYFPHRYTTSLYDGAVPGIATVVTKHRVRGSGDVLRIHLSNDGSKPFKLYGWQMVVEGSSRI